jgi:hypothetical protein
MSYQNIQYTSLKLPPDFDWKMYLEINDDVAKVCNNEECAKKHYLQDGIRQKRLYKTIHLPADFDWEIYLGLNQDVYNVCKTKLAAIMHYEKHGYSENRKYKLEHANINADFHWKKYLLKNPSLQNMIHNKMEALCHYDKIGKIQKLSYEYELPELPKDFDWKIYCELNPSLKSICSSKNDAEEHYMNKGMHENLLYKVPLSEIPNDFDWKLYLELNPDVKQIYPTEELAHIHYFITGKKEGRIYRFHHIPDNFDWKLYLDLNPTIRPEYRRNEIVTKLHYDLFGHHQELPYQTNFQNIPNDFDWMMYKKMNPDIQDLCVNEITTKCHYNEYGIYQSRKYKKTEEDIEQERTIQKYLNHPFMYHKYILGISKPIENIPYKISSFSRYNTNYKLIGHLHCFNIDQFDMYYGQYLETIQKYCELIIVTFSIGNENEIKKYKNTIYLQCENVGMDIGGKYVCHYFLKQKKIFYDSILFLHSKTDNQLRKLYWEPLIFHLDKIKDNLLDEQIGIYVPPLVYMGDYACIIYKDHFIEPCNITCKWNFGNSLYINDFDRNYDFSQHNYLFPEGNCFVCKKKIADILYGNQEDYYLLNSKHSFDAVWVKSYYGQKKLISIGPTIQDIFRFFKTYRSRPPLYPNNIAWGAGHRGHPDNMYEHVFERLVFKAAQKLKYKVKVMPHIDDPQFLDNLKIYNEKINQLLE